MNQSSSPTVASTAMDVATAVADVSFDLYPFQSIDDLQWQQTPFGEWVLPAVNDHSFQVHPSLAIYRQILGEAGLALEDTLYVFVGSDSGCLLTYLQTQLDQGRAALVLDYPQVIEAIEHRYADLLVEFKQKKLPLRLAGVDVNFNQLSDWFPFHAFAQRLVLLRANAVLEHPSLYAQVWEETEQRFNQYKYLQMFDRGARAFIDAGCRNLADNRFPLMAWKEAYAGKTAIIMAGGPSLDQHIDYIKQYRQQLLVFAVARIAKRLLKEDIQPDFVVSVDPNDISFDNSKDMLNLSPQVVFIHSYHVVPKLLAQWPGYHFYAGNRYPWSAKGAEKNIDIPGPTVTNSAIGVAIFMGCHQVLLTGVDLCFTASGQTHESASIEAQVGRFVHKGSHLVPTYDGGMAETSTDFYTAKQSLAQQIDVYRQSHPNVRLINLAPQAAIVEHVTHQVPESIVLSPIERVAADFAQTLIDQYPDAEKDAQAQIKTIQQRQSWLSDVMRQAKAGEKLAKQLFEEDHKLAKRSKAVIKAKNKLDQAIEEAGDFLFLYSPQTFDRVMKPDADDQQSNDEIVASLSDYFSAIQTVGDMVRPLLSETLDLTQARLDEAKDRTGDQLSLLSQVWKTHSQPGRIHVWLQRHDWSVLSTDHQAIVEQLKQAFDTVLAEQQTGIRKKFEKDIYAKLLDKVDGAVEAQKQPELNDMLCFCEDNADDESYRNIGLYTGGHLCELSGDLKQAVAFWDHVTHDKIRPSAMRAKLALALKHKQYTHAFTALEVLCTHDNKYFGIFADLVKTLGNPEGAVEIYTMYLQQVPDDEMAHSKIAQLYEQLGHKIKAIEHWQQVMKLTPKNPLVAQRLQRLQAQFGSGEMR